MRESSLGGAFVDQHHTEHLLGFWILALGGSGVGFGLGRLEGDRSFEVQRGVVVATKAEKVDLAHQQMHRGIVGGLFLGVDQLLQGLSVLEVFAGEVAGSFGLVGFAEHRDRCFVVAAARSDRGFVGAVGAGATKKCNGDDEQAGNAQHVCAVALPDRDVAGDERGVSSWAASAG